MAKNTVFIGYDYDKDKAAKERRLAWDASHEFDRRTSLCIVGDETYRSGWMAWKIRKAVEIKKKLVAAKRLLRRS